MVIHTFVVLAYKKRGYLEDCLKSVINQSIKSKILIATTTPNKYISNLAKKYNIKMVVGNHTTIGGDFDFARNVADTELVTIAHQDDIYEYTYAEEIVNNYRKYRNITILFSDYYEIRNKKKEYTNINLKIKRLLLLNLKIKKLSGIKHLKRNTIRYGNAISCPTVTYVQNKCPKQIFNHNMKCDIDWDAWEKLSKINGKFIYINKKIIGHRIEKITTTSINISQGIRTKEDQQVLEKFWPKSIAKFINKIYKKSEKNNILK